jgi:hypothetical protein
MIATREMTDRRRVSLLEWRCQGGITVTRLPVPIAAAARQTWRMSDAPSTTPLWKKLGVRPDGRLVVLGATSWSIDVLPDDVAVLDALPGTPLAAGDVVVAFQRDAAGYLADLGRLAAAIFPSATLWIAWPRKAGGHVSDLSDTLVRDAALPLGIVDTKVAMIDKDWSGLKFVWRRTAIP